MWGAFFTVTNIDQSIIGSSGTQGVDNVAGAEYALWTLATRANSAKPRTSMSNQVEPIREMEALIRKLRTGSTRLACQ